MEATLLLPSEFVVRPNFTTLAAVPCYRRRTSPSRVFAVLTSQPANRLVLEKVLVADPAEDHVRNSKSEAVVDNTLSRTVNHDSWFDLLATNHLSRSVQAAVGIRNEKRGYESLVEAARAVYKNFNPIQQRELVILALQKAFPSTVLNLIRTVLPNSGLAREFFAAFTTVFFAWLVGPCEVKESEFNGKKERNVVHIKKCRKQKRDNENYCRTALGKLHTRKKRM
ncbi:beta-carotene isomerase D27, chloroplastic isoform X2 [Punica granatum]|uniref:Beta-carotene isomerase D27, chloroplastic isoform X2 n=1 Tax=Punica granatum TaxID=22663 RepID=A0A6P8BXS2_PUNGR|nr:beta-carotene isomerase D27, chloroplastic isoform X2 [Punica granatum]